MPSLYGDHPERLTDRARRILKLAGLFAFEQRTRVSPEHVLWAIANTDPGVGFLALQELGINFTKDQEALKRLIREPVGLHYAESPRTGNRGQA